MATTILPTPVSGDFGTALFNFLKTPGIEGFEPFVYTDSVGIPTLGVGYALLTKDSTTRLWQPINLTLLQNTVGLSATQVTTLRNNLQAAANLKNGIFAALNPFPIWYPGIPSSSNVLDWEMTNTQSLTLFNAILPTYLHRVRTWLNNDALYTSLLDSKEMMALTSLKYNGYSDQALSDLKTAIVDGDRAEAWYLIRYVIPSKPFRDYAQSDLFGLYDTGAVTPDEALSIYRMFTKYRDHILTYERRNPPSNINNNSAPTITTLLTSARNTFVTWANTLLPSGATPLNANDWNAAAIFYNGISGSVADASVDNSLNASPLDGQGNGMENNLLVGGTGDNLMFGGKGNDVLIGQSGNDWLDGGDGNDTLSGGTGNDTLKGGVGDDQYIFGQDIGNNKIIDSDGKGTIWIAGTQLDTSPVAYNKTATKGTWGADGQTQYKYDSSLHTLTISGGSLGSGQIEIDNFDAAAFKAALDPSIGYLGIHLANPGVAALKEIGSMPTNPFDDSSFIPDSSSTPTTEMKDGGMSTYALYIPFAAGDAGQQIQIELSGDSANALRVQVGNQIITPSGGQFTVTIAAGEKETTFTLLAEDDVNSDETVSINATFVGAGGASGQPILLDTLTVDAKDAATQTNKDVQGGYKPMNFGTDEQPQYHYDDIGNVIVDTSQPLAADKKDTLLGGSYDAHIMGGQNLDSIMGGSGKNLIEGHGGADVIFGGSGNSRIFADTEVTMLAAIQSTATATGKRGSFIDGGSGNDLIVGNADNDVLMGGGNDTIIAGNGNNVIWGHTDARALTFDWTQTPGANGYAGYDPNDQVLQPLDYIQQPPGGFVIIYAGNGNNYIATGTIENFLKGSGQNYVKVGNGNNTIEMGNGDNNVTAGNGNNTIFGDDPSTPGMNDSNDYIQVGNGNNSLYGGGGDSSFIVGTGNDTIKGFDGNDYVEVQGGQGADKINVGEGNNTVYGGDGADTIIAGDGDNYVEAGAGSNSIKVGDGDNTLYAGDGNDSIMAGDGTNYIEVGNGNDMIKAGDGDNTIFVGDGNNQIQAGSGSNYIEVGNGNDTINLGNVSINVQNGSGTYLVSDSTGTTIYAGDGEGAPVQITAASGDITIVGGAGTNELHAGSGSDVLVAGSGDTNMYGGGGTTTYQINAYCGDAQIANATGSDTVQFGPG